MHKFRFNVQHEKKKEKKISKEKQNLCKYKLKFFLYYTFHELNKHFQHKKRQETSGKNLQDNLF